MKLVFLDEATLTLGDIDFGALQALGEYRGFARTDAGAVIERCGDAEVVLTNKVLFSSEVLYALPRLKLISIAATGYNNVDLAAARRQGVTVCNVPGYAVHSVAQHTFAMILNLASQVHRYDADVKAGRWHISPLFTMLSYPTFELAGKTLGIIGMGSIGEEVARLARAFHMNVVYSTRTAKVVDGCRQAALRDLLTCADIVSVHCPLTEQTRNMIDTPELKRMKPTAMLVNLARGGIVNEAALAEALNTGQIAGAATDVLTEEPPRNGNVLLTAKNMLVTPHSAWSTREARQRLIEEMTLNIQGFFTGRGRNVVQSG